ncbi:MAG TPA: hypothetical protein VGQ83_11845 [Polyangia bacterium]|jgi:hypothetical protein
MRTTLRAVLLAAGVVTLGGCLLMTQRFDLVYQRGVTATGGRGELLLARPIESHGLAKDGDGRWILGTTAMGGNLVTQDDIGNWVAAALVEELGGAGYAVKPVATLPPGASRGLQVSIIRIAVKHEATGWGSAAPSKLALDFRLFKDGANVKGFVIEAKGDYSNTSANFARQKSLSLQKALQVALEQAVPEIVRTLEQP